MEKFRIIGVAEKKGVYKETPFHNLELFATFNTGRNELGVQGAKFKIKWIELRNVFELEQNTNPVLDTFSNIVGKECYIYFDRWKNATLVKVIHNSDSKPKN